jgi:RimJ/RimL family protein N-acetyltransferase
LERPLEPHAPASHDAGDRTSGAEVLVTERLRLRRLVLDDAGLLLELLNDAAFLENVGDRGVRTIADARAYLERGPLRGYERHGFDLFRVELRDSGEPVGLCGVLRREELPAPDLGFAFLPRHRSRGYAVEAASAVLAFARSTLGLRRLLAITLPTNAGSRRVLERIGFRATGTTRLGADPAELVLYESS